MMLFFLNLLFTFTFSTGGQGFTGLPERPAGALSGSALETQLRNLSLTDRENRIFSEILSGNIPDFLRTFSEVTVTRTIKDTSYTLVFHVAPDYLALGSDEDYFLIPMTPLLAQRLANQLGFSMPTRRMVDQIWQSAPLKLNPQPIPPSDQMTTIPVMFTHNTMVREQRGTHLQQHPQGTLVAGHKKDVILSNRIYNQPPPGRVVIYGWHYTSGSPIQPVYSGHSETYADYSHGIRAVRDTVLLNGQPMHIRSVLQHPSLHELISDEGPVPMPFYPLETTRRVPDNWGVQRAGTTSLRLLLPDAVGITDYQVHLSPDGRNFTKTLSLSASDNHHIEGLQPDTPVYIRMQAVTDHPGPFSEVLAGFPSANTAGTLIVNGFDRAITGNTRDFIRKYVPAVLDAGEAFDSATNEAVALGSVTLTDYQTVIWILGAESTVDETFSAAEQNKVRAFLDAGGNLMVSGSEIGWDLDHRGNSADRAFMHQYLKSAYVADAPSNQRDTWYSVDGLADSPFSSFQNIRFDNGSQGTWNVSWPDVLRAEQGGEIVFRYRGAPLPNGAGIAYKGPFPGSADGVNGSVAVFGFPLETVYPDANRTMLIKEMITWMHPSGTNIPDYNHDSDIPVALQLDPNYPNPFNTQTTLRYRLAEDAHVQLSVFTPLGEQVANLVDSWQRAGSHQVNWNALSLASGVYISRLSSAGSTVSRPMLLLK
jgi:hypothetical protein